MGKIIKAEKRGGGGIESKVTEEYTPLHARQLKALELIIPKCAFSEIDMPTNEQFLGYYDLCSDMIRRSAYFSQVAVIL